MGGGGDCGGWFQVPGVEPGLGGDGGDCGIGGGVGEAGGTGAVGFGWV